LKQIRDGANSDAPNAPTLAEMEVETEHVGGNGEVLVEFSQLVEAHMLW
jgi:hypothetical protein